MCKEKRGANWHGSSPSEELREAEKQAAKRANMNLWDIDPFEYHCMLPDWYCGYFIKASKPEKCRNFCLELNKIPQELNPLSCDYMMVRHSPRMDNDAIGWGWEYFCLPVHTGMCETESDPDPRRCEDNPVGCTSEITWKRRRKCHIRMYMRF